MPRCYVPEAVRAGTEVVLSDAEAHHIANVLRLQAGDAVIVFDGHGHEWDARVATVTRGAVSLDVAAARTPAPEPAVALTLAMAILKGDQMDAVVRDATALGAHAIQPMVTAHVVVPERVWARDGLPDRWHRIAVAAAKQCGRAVVPAIAPVRALSEVARHAPSPRVMCVEPMHGPSSEQLGAAPSSATLFVGPEGGWSLEELALLTDGDTRRLTLGPRTLRAELAPVVAMTALWTKWGW
jgi:16S rRNA (uracil1498-N3)-methyltransferase